MHATHSFSLSCIWALACRCRVARREAKAQDMEARKLRQKEMQELKQLEKAERQAESARKQKASDRAVNVVVSLEVSCHAIQFIVCNFLWLCAKYYVQEARAKKQAQLREARKMKERDRKQASRAETKAEIQRVAIDMAAIERDMEMAKWRARAEQAEKLASARDQEAKTQEAVAAAVNALGLQVALSPSCLALRASRACIARAPHGHPGLPNCPPAFTSIY